MFPNKSKPRMVSGKSSVISDIVKSRKISNKNGRKGL